MKGALILLALLAGMAWAADPYVGYIYPAGVQAGTTNRLIVGGQFFWNLKGVEAGPGVRVLGFALVPNFPPPVGGQRRYLVKWLDRIAEGDRTQPRPLRTSSTPTGAPTAGTARSASWMRDSSRSSNTSSTRRATPCRCRPR